PNAIDAKMWKEAACITVDVRLQDGLTTAGKICMAFDKKSSPREVFFHANYDNDPHDPLARVLMRAEMRSRGLG
ncbi:MAG: hypothetical protein WCD70_15940, partial [Alphaproteobacteria bacterium]